MTGKFRIQIDDRYHCCGFIALREDDPHPLIIMGPAFQCIAGASCVLQITFFIIDGTAFHDLFHFLLRNMAAIHAATGMIAVLNKTGAPVEPMVTVGLRCRILWLHLMCNVRLGVGRLTALKVPDQEQQQAEGDDQDIWEPLLIQCQTFGSK